MINFKFEAQNVDVLEKMIKEYAKEELAYKIGVAVIGTIMVTLVSIYTYATVGVVLMFPIIFTLIIAFLSIHGVVNDIKELIKDSNFSYNYELNV